MEDMRDPYGFLGRGFHFPPSVDKTTGRVLEAGYEEDIAQAIRIIIGTRKGERFMRPDFGCGISDYVFGDINYSTIKGMEQAVTEALVRWEPRITDIQAVISCENASRGELDIQVNYRVRSTNNPYNLVFPYFIQEGI